MDLEHRMDRLEDKVVKIDERQQDLDRKFAEFMTRVDMYMKNNDATIAEVKERMNRVEDKMDKLSNQIQNLTTATAVGVAAIVIAVVLSR